MAQGSRTRQANKTSYLYCISMSFVRQPHQHFKTGNTAVFSSVAGKHKGQLSNKIIALAISQGHILHDPNILMKLPCLEKGKSFSFFFNPNACLKKHVVLSRSLSLACWWPQKSSMLAVVCTGEVHSPFHKQTCQFLDFGSYPFSGFHHASPTCWIWPTYLAQPSADVVDHAAVSQQLL